MNLFKMIACRSVQLTLRAALPVLPYSQPQRLSSIEALPEVLHQHHIERVLLITDKGIRNCHLTEPLEKVLAASHIHCTVYDGTTANPTDTNVQEAYDLYCANHCQALIGFGGGSSMDCAKGCGARIARPSTPLSKMEGVLRVHKKLPLLIAVPTTAGTGSEVTLAAVITDSQTHHKYAISDFCLIPKVAVLDPEITRSLPPFITACTGMDALTHAVEAYIGRSTTKETRHDATEAVRLIFANLPQAYHHGDDMEARANMLKAAYLAGNAFSQSYVGYIHAVAHSLSGKYNVAHGLANAVLMPGILDAYGSCIHKKLARLAIAAGVADESDSPAVAANAFINAIRQFNREFGIPDVIKELKKEDICELARTADKEANPLYPVPVLLSAKQLEGFYEKVREDHHGENTDPQSCTETESLLPGRKDTGCQCPDFITAKS